MIASGEKKEEYREVKPYWEKRLYGHYNDFDELLSFDIVEFRHGYKSDAPRIKVEFDKLIEGTGRPEWGAEPGKTYFVIKLGKILSTTGKPGVK